jgi:hypothetical protein
MTSSGYNNNCLKGQERVIDICTKENASVYVNAIGGMDLYDKDDFEKAGLDLFFLRAKPIIYSQFNDGFVPRLSVIDVMMFNSIDKIKQMLNEYELL